MNSNLPIKRDNSLIERIKNFFRRIFFKEQIENSYEDKTEVESKLEQEDRREMAFKESLRVEVSNNHIKEKERKEFLNKLEKNPELLYALSVEKLERLEKYYEEILKKQEEKLMKMRKAGQE